MANKRRATKTKSKTTKASKTTKSTAISQRSKAKNVFDSLKKWNLVFGSLLILQALAVLIIGKATTLPVVTHFLAKDTLASQLAGHNVMALAVRHLWDIDLRYLVLIFLLISGVIQLLLATKLRNSYEADLDRRTNRWRWLDYSLSASVMLVAIGLLNGIYDLVSLIMIVTLVAMLHFLGYGIERFATLKDKWQNFAAVCLVGGTIWLAVAIYVKGAIMYGVGLSQWVYLIDGLIFIFTLTLAANKWQLIKAKGKWADYIYGEKLFIILSFVGRTALTWLIFAGFLR